MPKQSRWFYFVRGAQFVLHDLRMSLPVVERLLGLGLVLFLLVSLGVFWRITLPYERYVGAEYAQSLVIGVLDPQVKTLFKDWDGHRVEVTYAVIQDAPGVQAVVRGLEQSAIRSARWGMYVTFLGEGFLALGLVAWGRRRSQDKHLKGDQLELKPPTQKKAILSARFSRFFLKRPSKRHSVMPLKIATVSLPPGVECGHLLFHGTTGTGKSTAIQSLLDQIRARGDRAIVYDKSCSYLESFYQDQDVLLNPLDARGQAWDLWAECRDSADFDSLAAAQIPMPLSTQDPFWIHAARTIFSAAAFKMRLDPDRSLPKLLQYLLSEDLGDIQAYLKGTEAETLVSEKIEKTAISIKSVLATYLKSLKYLQTSNAPFSIRNWIQDETAQHWLFITSLGDRHETLKPLISAWLDVAVNALLSLPPNPDRRIWLILDELPSLQQLPYLTATLSESRKFGGCVVMGVQNIAQLEQVYGTAGAREISALLNTRVMFREPDPDMAKWSAQNLGERITQELRDGLSMGTGARQEIDSLYHHESRKPLVSFSEIMQLPNLSAYLRLPGPYPIRSVRFDYTPRVKEHPGFIAQPDDEAPVASAERLPTHDVDDLDTLAEL